MFSYILISSSCAKSGLLHILRGSLALGGVYVLNCKNNLSFQSNGLSSSKRERMLLQGFNPKYSWILIITNRIEN